MRTRLPVSQREKRWTVAKLLLVRWPRQQVLYCNAMRASLRRFPETMSPEGYTQRYGLIYMDFRSQKRTVEDSGYWYARVAASTGWYRGRVHRADEQAAHRIAFSA